MPSTLQQPWDQLPTENNEAFAHFRQFLMMPERPRSYVVFASRVNLSHAWIKALGSKHGWRNRAMLYDNYVTGLTEKERVEAIKSYQLEVISSSVADARYLRDRWEETIEKMLDPENEAKGEIRPVDLVRLAQVRNMIDIIMRRAAELPSNYTALAPGEKVPEDTSYELTLEGPKRDSKATAITRVPGDYQ